MAHYEDADAVLVIDGKEGTGKSVLALQIAKLMDIDGEIDVKTQLHFNSESVLKTIRNDALRKGKVVIYDESAEALDVSLSGTKKQKKIKQMFMEVRQQNLIFILVIPSFYDMQKYFAIHRTRALLHVFWKKKTKKPKSDADRMFQRGFYYFYNEEGMNRLYNTDKLRKFYVYPRKLSEFTGKFPKDYAGVDEEEYRRRKASFSSSLGGENAPPPPVDWRHASVKVAYEMEERGVMGKGWRPVLADVLGFSPDYLREIQAKDDVVDLTSTQSKG